MSKTSSTSKTTKVIHCTCNHDYQDQLHGNHRRVANLCGGAKAGKGWRCTVCGVKYDENKG